MEPHLAESPADPAAHVRALLKQCCRMCVPGQHACDQRAEMPFETVESPGRLDPIGPLDTRLQERLTQASGRPLTRTNRVRLLRDGADTFTAMLALIEHADAEILLENYIIRADSVGRAFGDALTTRAQRGVDVRILHDPFGDPLSLLALHMQFWRSPARLSVYNPPRPTRRYLRAWRDHRKLIVQDRTRFVAGGLCVADVWLGNCVRNCTWRDSAVLVEGGAAPHAAEEFDRLWHDAFALTWRRRTAKPPPSLPPVVAGDVPVRVLADEPGKRCTEQALVAAINAAQSEVLVTNQYAVPTPPLADALVAAGRRHVDVQLILPPGKAVLRGLREGASPRAVARGGSQSLALERDDDACQDGRHRPLLVAGGIDEPGPAQPSAERGDRYRNPRLSRGRAAHLPSRPTSASRARCSSEVDETKMLIGQY